MRPLDFAEHLSNECPAAGMNPPTIAEVQMARKSVRKKKAAPATKKTARVARRQVVTFRLSDQEAALIAKAADREPLARYSRRAVLAAAEPRTGRRK